MFASDKLERLPDAGGDVDAYWRLAAAFLVDYPPHSSRLLRRPEGLARLVRA